MRHVLGLMTLIVAFLMTMSFSLSADEPRLYEVRDGNKVDPKTLQGWKTWRALACERCHGAEQEGLVGPPLVESLKVLSKEEFHNVMMNGRPEKGMPPFNTSQMVMQNWEGLYAYLKGRSDGQIQPGRLSPLE
jgi:Cytochrome C oxidase, cbb3-type, subunit III